MIDGIAIRSTSHVYRPHNDHFHILVIVEQYDQGLDDILAVTTSALVDSGASTTFISKRLVNELQFKTRGFLQEIPLLNIDRTRNNAGSITHYVELTLAVPHARGHISTTIFAVTDIDDQDIIIRIDWLAQHNPRID